MTGILVAAVLCLAAFALAGRMRLGWLAVASTGLAMASGLWLLALYVVTETAGLGMEVALAALTAECGYMAMRVPEISTLRTPAHSAA